MSTRSADRQSHRFPRLRAALFGGLASAGIVAAAVAFSPTAGAVQPGACTASGLGHCSVDVARPAVPPRPLMAGGGRPNVIKPYGTRPYGTKPYGTRPYGTRPY
jgi:hypothetical protein